MRWVAAARIASRVPLPSRRRAEATAGVLKTICTYQSVQTYPQSRTASRINHDLDDQPRLEVARQIEEVTHVLRPRRMGVRRPHPSNPRGRSMGATAVPGHPERMGLGGRLEPLLSYFKTA